MSTVEVEEVEKIVFIADKISAERVYDGVGELRELAFADLDSAVNEFQKTRGVNS
jgi:HD superfamily phosphohydrolase YqeK